jgi:uncharacterized protein (DUF58 family)
MSYKLPLVPDFLSSYIEKFANKRLPEPDYKASIIRQRLYILPTRHGIAFFIILILTLTGAINYENSLAFMLTFLLASICFLGMIYSHQNINNLIFRSSPAKPVFSGQTALFPVSIRTSKKRSHFSICFETYNSSSIRCNLLQQQDEANISIPVKASNRGYFALEQIKISTEFPLCLFHAWSWINLKSQCLVYPKPEHYPFNTSHSNNNSGNHSQLQAGYDDFSGIREYQREDSPNHLAWKAIAKTGVLQTKQFHGNTNNEIYLNWFDLPDKMDIEKRLSIICYWVIESEKQGIKYGLKLPTLSIEPESGLHHYQNCLKELALFGK